MGYIKNILYYIFSTFFGIVLIVGIYFILVWDWNGPVGPGGIHFTGAYAPSGIFLVGVSLSMLRTLYLIHIKRKRETLKIPGWFFLVVGIIITLYSLFTMVVDGRNILRHHFPDFLIVPFVGVIFTIIGNYTLNYTGVRVKIIDKILKITPQETTK